jgi:hypothetical protein
MMFAIFAPPADGLGLPWRGSGREPRLRHGLVLIALIVLAGLAMSVLAGLPTPGDLLTILEETR